MTLAQLRKFCAKLPGSVEDVKWENDLCFCIAGKMYAVTGMGDGRSNGKQISLKVPEPLRPVLLEQEGYEVAPYVGRFGWLVVSSPPVPKAEAEKLIRTSYDLILSKLPKKKQREILGD